MSEVFMYGVGKSLINENNDGSKSWLVAIAKAMGEAMGNQAAKLVGLANDLSAAAGDDSKAGAQKFSALSSEFQAQSQMFNIMSNTINTSLKSLGEGMTSVARKQG